MSLEHVDSSYDSVLEVHSAVNGLPFLAESLSSVSLSFALFSAFLVFLYPTSRSLLHCSRTTVPAIEKRYVLPSRFDPGLSQLAALYSRVLPRDEEITSSGL